MFYYVDKYYVKQSSNFSSEHAGEIVNFTVDVYDNSIGGSTSPLYENFEICREKKAVDGDIVYKKYKNINNFIKIPNPYKLDEKVYLMIRRDFKFLFFYIEKIIPEKSMVCVKPAQSFLKNKLKEELANNNKINTFLVQKYDRKYDLLKNYIRSKYDPAEVENNYTVSMSGYTKQGIFYIVFKKMLEETHNNRKYNFDIVFPGLPEKKWLFDIKEITMPKYIDTNYDNYGFIVDIANSVGEKLDIYLSPYNSKIADIMKDLEQKPAPTTRDRLILENFNSVVNSKIVLELTNGEYKDCGNYLESFKSDENYNTYLEKKNKLFENDKKRILKTSGITGITDSFTTTEKNDYKNFYKIVNFHSVIGDISIMLAPYQMVDPIKYADNKYKGKNGLFFTGGDSHRPPTELFNRPVVYNKQFRDFRRILPPNILRSYGNPKKDYELRDYWEEFPIFNDMNGRHLLYHETFEGNYDDSEFNGYDKRGLNITNIFTDGFMLAIMFNGPKCDLPGHLDGALPRYISPIMIYGYNNDQLLLNASSRKNSHAYYIFDTVTNPNFYTGLYPKDYKDDSFLSPFYYDIKHYFLKNYFSFDTDNEDGIAINDGNKKYLQPKKEFILWETGTDNIKRAKKDANGFYKCINDYIHDTKTIQLYNGSEITVRRQDWVHNILSFSRIAGKVSNKNLTMYDNLNIYRDINELSNDVNNIDDDTKIKINKYDKNLHLLTKQNGYIFKPKVLFNHSLDNIFGFGAIENEQHSLNPFELKTPTLSLEIKENKDIKHTYLEFGCFFISTFCTQGFYNFPKDIFKTKTDVINNVEITSIDYKNAKVFGGLKSYIIPKLKLGEKRIMPTVSLYDDVKKRAYKITNLEETNNDWYLSDIDLESNYCVDVNNKPISSKKYNEKTGLLHVED